MIGDPTEAEDLTQEAFLLLFRKIHTFRGESAFSAWPQRLAVSVVLEATPDSEDEMLTGGGCAGGRSKGEKEDLEATSWQV